MLRPFFLFFSFTRSGLSLFITEFSQENQHSWTTTSSG